MIFGTWVDVQVVAAFCKYCSIKRHSSFLSFRFSLWLDTLSFNVIVMKHILGSFIIGPIAIDFLTAIAVER